MAFKGRKARVRINTASSGDNTLVSAISPGIIEIDHITVIPTGGANTLGFLDGSTTIFSLALDDNQAYVFDNSGGEYPITLSNNSALVLNLSAATQVDGFILYRVMGDDAATD